MAASSRRHPNLDDCVGLNWSRWADMLDVSPPDVGSDAEDSSDCGRNPTETMTLRKEDMHIYGHCPAHDDFYLVMCSHCSQVVKPGAFEKHCERRHGLLTKTCGQPSTLAPLQRPLPGPPPSNLSLPRARKDGSYHQDATPSSAALPAHQHRSSKAQREAASLTSAGKSSRENPPQQQQHSPAVPRSRVPPCHSGPLPPDLTSSSTPHSAKPSEQMSTAGQSRDFHAPQRGTRTYSRIYKNINTKDPDLDKHSKTVELERKTLSSRELTCNTDSAHQQQKAQGRTRTFDHPSAEQRERLPLTGRDLEQLLVKSKDKEQRSEAHEEKITQGSRNNLSSTCHILRSKDTEENFPEEEGDGPVEAEGQRPCPFNQSLLSCEESEDDEREENAGLPSSPYHPKPLGLCTFGCRTLGRTIFTFDRRLHHLRFALNTMLEHHVSMHMWKKMPQVSPGLRSCHVTPPAARAPAKPFQSAGSLSLDSTSIQLENKTTQHSSPSTKPPSSTSSVSLGPGRRSKPVRQQSKVQQKEAVLMQDASAARKAARLPQSNKAKSPRYIRDAPLHEKGQPRPSSCKAPASGNFSQGKKPCPTLPLQPSERHLSGLEKRSPLPAKTPPSPCSRGRASGIQQKAVAFDRKGRGQKRKGSNESPPSSGTKTSKCKRLSSPSPSRLLTWKGENIGDVLAWGLDKTSNS